MNRRQLTFIILVNALVSLVIALGVAWGIEARRPDLEELAALYTPLPQAVLAAPATAGGNLTVLPRGTADGLPTTNAGAPSPASTPAPTVAPGEQTTYVVEVGDSLLSIAAQFGVTVDDIVALNELANPDIVFSGQRLRIPGQVQAAGTATPPPVANGSTSSANGSTGAIEIRDISAAGNLLDEAVLIVNESDVVFNLQGWRLERENGPAYTFGNLPLFPGGSVWVHSRAGDDTSIALYWQQASAVWQSGAVARLLNAQDELVAQYPVP